MTNSRNRTVLAFYTASINSLKKNHREEMDKIIYKKLFAALEEDLAFYRVNRLKKMKHMTVTFRSTPKKFTMKT